jgi:ribokinase
MIYILVVNEVEVEQACRSLSIPVGDHKAMAKALSTRGKTTCILTLADKGSIVAKSDGSTFHVNSLELDEVVDTTGAGDAYCGTLAACLYDGMDLEDSVRWASAAGSLACTELGTITAFAYQDDVKERLDEVKVTR